MKSITEITVYTKGEIFDFNGENADKVYRAIDDAIRIGASWTNQIELTSGKCCVFAINNIEYYHFK